jgi:enediyne biosynthesis protein E4
LNGKNDDRRKEFINDNLNKMGMIYHKKIVECLKQYDDAVKRGFLPFLLTAVFMLGFFSLWSQSVPYPFVFSEAANSAGLLPDVSGIRGHGAAWGDVDGDGWIDLYVGTFNEDGSKLSMFFRNKGSKFVLDTQKVLNISTRATGVIFADLDNDGDLDLYIGSMPQPKKNIQGNTLFRNDGKGVFTDVSKDNGACPLSFGGRSATVLDYDGDGLLDILAGEDPMPGYNGSKTKSSRLFHNKGNLQFEDVTQAAGIPADIPGYGVAVADVNNDGWPDFFLAANSGGNRLFLNNKGRFTEFPPSSKLFYWEGSGGDNMVCGVSFGDVNRDGLMDIVMGPHFQKPWITPQPLRLFINSGIKNGLPNFVEVTEKAGLKPLPMKAPHVEIQDFDNDGWPDIYTSLVKFKDGKPYPSIAKHLGILNGIPRFKEDAMKINDFPTNEDKGINASKQLFEKMLKERKVIYSAPGPTGDYDNDGRLDMFLANWWTEEPSMLLHNETVGGNWLQIQVKGSNGVNLMGVGSRVKIYKAGKLGQSSALLGCQDIGVGYGYASGHAAMAHFGLGKEASVDVEVILPHGRGKLSKKKVRANQRITIE